MNPAKDDTSNNASNIQHDEGDDVFLQAHDLAVDMHKAEHLIAEVDAGHTALRREVELENNQEETSDSQTDYLGSIEIPHEDTYETVLDEQEVFQNSAPEPTSDKSDTIIVKKTPPDIENPYPDSHSLLAG